MKALTVWQPWASLIIAGAKPYEFRGWRFPRSMLGQRIVIHAAARKMDRDEVNDLLVVLALRNKSADIARAAAETCLVPEKAIPVLNLALEGELPMAAGVGSVVLGEPVIGTAVAEQFGVLRANDSDRDEYANWGWPMLDIDWWGAPVSMRGAQGFWTWPTPEAVLL